MNEEIRQELIKMSEPELAAFQGKLIPGAGNILGIRLPALRKYAKTLCKEYGEQALCGEDVYYEETMLRGFIIGYLKLPVQQRLELIRSFVPLIDNWAVCDSFCSTIKPKKDEQEEYFALARSYSSSEKEFEQRFSAVMLMKFIDDEHISETLTLLSQTDTTAYYSSMAVAWALAECCIKYPSESAGYFSEQYFDSITLRRAGQKLRDSRRSAEHKKKK